jgi:hypothetical protein
MRDSELRLLTGVERGAEGVTFNAVVVPSGISWLDLARATEAAPRLVKRRPRVGRPALCFEPVSAGGRDLLLMAGGDAAGTRVNGLPAPPLATLGIRDEIRVGRERILHLSALRSPHIGPPASDRVGEECPVCRVEFREDTVVYTCSCGQPLHLEGEEVPEDDRLQCALTARACVVCRRFVRLEGGYEYVPEV